MYKVDLFMLFVNLGNYYSDHSNFLAIADWGFQRKYLLTNPSE